MSNKIIFNLDELFISLVLMSVLISWMSIALPNQQLCRKNLLKSYTIKHEFLSTTVSKIKKQKSCILWKVVFSSNPREFIITSSAIFVIWANRSED